MNEEDINILCRLMRDHEDLVGASRVSMLGVEAFIKSIEELKSTPEGLRQQLIELAEAIKLTRPRIIPLIHLVEEFESEMAPFYGEDMATARRKAVEILRTKYDKLKGKVGRIIELGLTCIQEGDVIVMHSASEDVTNMVAKSKEELNRNIKVIVLKQDFQKTKKLINTLTRAKVDLETVPEFSLSHYIGRANKLFTCALSITHDLKVVCSVGTANVASLCHFHGVPVYLFINTLKFSHGMSEDQCINEKRVSQTQDQCCYVLTTYSHDMVDIGMIDYLISEEGIFPKDKIRDYVAEIQARNHSGPKL